MAQERFYNVAVMDISLPDIDGTELLSRLLDMHPDVVAIMLTGYSSVQNAIQSLNSGAFSYLEKPLDPDHLLSVMRRGLERQRLVLENRRLMAELERHNRETSILLSVSQAVSRSLEVEQIIQSALDKVAETMEIDASYVHLVEDGHLVLRGHRGFESKTVEEIEEVEVNGDITGSIVKSARPVLLQSLDDTENHRLTCMARAGYRSFAGIPLTIMGETIGAMGVAAYSDHSFTTEHVDLLGGIGKEISIAIRNAQLYEEASSNKSLREIDDLRTEFLANVSHELRTPLAAIKGFASTLLQPDVNFDEESRRDFLQTIDQEADRLNRLIDELLVMSCLEAGALEVRREPRSMAEVIESIRGRLNSLASRHSLRVEVQADIPKVIVDDGHVGEVLTNLVQNAVKYSHEGTPITIEVHPEGDRIITSVIDEGIGIPSEFHEKIFDRFCKLEDAVNGYRSGSGLGLSICRGIVEAHGGEIWVESEPGEGSRFSFSLPTDCEGCDTHAENAYPCRG
jgi:K+-sensing histidine kinase KdpD